MIIGTAGHIDHGKTALVRALSGVDTDRLAEEKRRGITIELGFAPVELPGVGVAGIVDVPGHEAFVRTMVAGATGIDLALIVVAADEGIKPQTREHIAVLQLLGVSHAVIAITKCDKVDVARAVHVAEDTRSLIARTGFASAPAVHVSAVTGQGVDVLKERLARSAREVGDRHDDDYARLPVDRVFAKAGSGTIVTGTLWSGRIQPEDSVRILPRDLVARVRTVQQHSATVDAVSTGTRTALALAGVSTDDVRRGDVVVTGDVWRATSVFRADVSLLEGASPVTPRTRLRLHHGTTDVGARVVTADGSLRGHEMRAARVVVDTPIVVRGEDRFVLRRDSEGTVGGGLVTDALPHKQRTRPFTSVRVSREQRLQIALDEGGSSGVPVNDLPIRFGGRPQEWTQLIAGMAGVQAIDETLVSAQVLDRAKTRVLAWLDTYHQQHPSDRGGALASARALFRSGRRFSAFVLGQLVGAGEIVVEGTLVRRAGWTPVEDPDAVLCEQLVRRLDAAAAAAPSVGELQREFSRPLLPLFRRLEREGKIVALAADRFASARAAADLWSAIRERVTEGRGYRPSELRAVFGVSRQYLIPWLEYFDRQGWSRRVGDERRFVIHRTP